MIIYFDWTIRILNHRGFCARLVRLKAFLILTSNIALNYIFSKPELVQARNLRKIVIDHDSYKLEYESMQKRKMISLTLKLEKFVKSIIYKK